MSSGAFSSSSHCIRASETNIMSSSHMGQGAEDSTQALYSHRECGSLGREDRGEDIIGVAYGTFDTKLGNNIDYFFPSPQQPTQPTDPGEGPLADSVVLEGSGFPKQHMPGAPPSVNIAELIEQYKLQDFCFPDGSHDSFVDTVPFVLSSSGSVKKISEHPQPPPSFESSAGPSGGSSAQSPIPIFGFACYHLYRDPTVHRGAVQRSFLVLSRRPLFHCLRKVARQAMVPFLDAVPSTDTDAHRGFVRALYTSLHEAFKKSSLPSDCPVGEEATTFQGDLVNEDFATSDQALRELRIFNLLYDWQPNALASCEAPVEATSTPRSGAESAHTATVLPPPPPQLNPEQLPAVSLTRDRAPTLPPTRDRAPTLPPAAAPARRASSTDPPGHEEDLSSSAEGKGKSVVHRIGSGMETVVIEIPNPTVTAASHAPSTPASNGSTPPKSPSGAATPTPPRRPLEMELRIPLVLPRNDASLIQQISFGTSLKKLLTWFGDKLPLIHYCMLARYPVLFVGQHADEVSMAVCASAHLLSPFTGEGDRASSRNGSSPGFVPGQPGSSSNSPRTGDKPTLKPSASAGSLTNITANSSGGATVLDVCAFLPYATLDMFDRVQEVVSHPTYRNLTTGAEGGQDYDATTGGGDTTPHRPRHGGNGVGYYIAVGATNVHIVHRDIRGMLKCNVNDGTVIFCNDSNVKKAIGDSRGLSESKKLWQSAALSYLSDKLAREAYYRLWVQKLNLEIKAECDARLVSGPHFRTLMVGSNKGNNTGIISLFENHEKHTTRLDSDGFLLVDDFSPSTADPNSALESDAASQKNMTQSNLANAATDASFFGSSNRSNTNSHLANSLPSAHVEISETIRNYLHLAKKNRSLLVELDAWYQRLLTILMASVAAESSDELVAFAQELLSFSATDEAVAGADDSIESCSSCPVQACVYQQSVDREIRLRITIDYRERCFCYLDALTRGNYRAMVRKSNLYMSDFFLANIVGAEVYNLPQQVVLYQSDCTQVLYANRIKYKTTGTVYLTRNFLLFQAGKLALTKRHQIVPYDLLRGVNRSSKGTWSIFDSASIKMMVDMTPNRKAETDSGHAGPALIVDKRNMNETTALLSFTNIGSGSDAFFDILQALYMKQQRVIKHLQHIPPLHVIPEGRGAKMRTTAGTEMICPVWIPRGLYTIASCIVYDEVWENQRLYPLLGWKSRLLPSDPPSFSDFSGYRSLSCDNSPPAPCPQGFEWVDTTWVMACELPDEEPTADRLLATNRGAHKSLPKCENKFDRGFLYNFSSHWYVADGFRTHECAGGVIRRRLWVRRRRLISNPAQAEYYKQLESEVTANNDEPQNTHVDPTQMQRADSLSPLLQRKGMHKSFSIVLDDENLEAPPVISTRHRSAATTAFTTPSGRYRNETVCGGQSFSQETRLSASALSTIPDGSGIVRGRGLTTKGRSRFIERDISISTDSTDVVDPHEAEESLSAPVAEENDDVGNTGRGDSSEKGPSQPESEEDRRARIDAEGSRPPNWEGQRQKNFERDGLL